MRKTNIYIIIAAINSLFFFLIWTHPMVIGAFINSILSCDQNPVNSFPCYGIYDIIALIFTGISSFVSLVLAIIFINHKNS